MNTSSVALVALGFKVAMVLAIIGWIKWRRYRARDYSTTWPFCSNLRSDFGAMIDVIMMILCMALAIAIWKYMYR